MTFPLYAHHETSIGFFLGDTVIQLENHTSKRETEKNKVFLFGVSTACGQSMISSGNYHTFTIEFKPDGFNRMFGIPANEVSNKIVAANDVIGNAVANLHLQLLHASSELEIVNFADKFLLGILARKKASYRNEGVSKIAYHLITNNNLANISQYAFQANMSVRNFERRFVEQVGVSPKSFCRLVRFNTALNFKISNPKTSWTKVAYEFGYYDSMHLIKDFKQFTNTNPANLLTGSPGFIDNNCYKVQPLYNC